MIRRLEFRRVTAVVVAVALLVSYPLLFVAAALPVSTDSLLVDVDSRLAGCWLFLVVAVVGYLAEVWAPRAAPYLVDTLAWLQVGVTTRWVFREVALIILVDRALTLSPLQLAAFALGVLGLHGLRAVFSALVIYVVRSRRLPVVTRNVDLGGLRIADAPPGWLVADHSKRVLWLDVLPVAGGLAAALTAVFAWALAGVCVALAVGALCCVVMSGYARRNRPLRDTARTLAAVHARVSEYRPQVVLYFSGTVDSVYQVNMWLSTVAQLGRPAVVIMRERALVPLLGRTSLPVVCLDGTVELMNFPLPSVRVALFPSNTGKNLHQLRVAGVGHVFIGHGDSDKSASFNPFAKVYDEVWVAGRAGRDRYLRAQVGVRDEDIVEVGRPQLSGIRAAGGGPAGAMFTVLYAPTWEGWLDDDCQASLAAMGARIIRALTSHSPHIRVLYKPHPLTGTRDPRAARAHQAIAALIGHANRQREAGGAGDGQARAGEQARLAAAAEMARTGTRLTTLAGGPATGGPMAGLRSAPDEAMLSRDSRPDTTGDTEWRQLNSAWHAAYWQAQGWWRHRVVTGPLPTLNECFNHADLLISDISSVVADFIASGKPYAVTNPAGLAEDQFRTQFPTAAAGYLLGAGCAELPAILAQAATPGGDPLTAARRELKSYLLGPDDPDALTRFSAAVETLATRVAKPAGEDPALNVEPLLR